VGQEGGRRGERERENREESMGRRRTGMLKRAERRRNGKERASGGGRATARHELAGVGKDSH